MVGSDESRQVGSADTTESSVMARDLNLTEIAMRLKDGSLDESKVSPEILKKARKVPIVMGGVGRIDAKPRSSRSDRFQHSLPRAARQ